MRLGLRDLQVVELLGLGLSGAHVPRLLRVVKGRELDGRGAASAIFVLTGHLIRGI